MFAIFAVALAVRLGVVAATPAYAPRHDDRDYDQIGWSMAQGQGYPPILVRRDRRVVRVYADAYRPPLWPATLAAVYTVFGHRLAAARVADAIVGALGVVALAWVALRLLGSRAAWWAGTLGAVYLPLALVASTLVSETLFVAFELLALALALEARGRGRIALAVGAGAAAGLGALTRVNGELLLVAIVPLVALPGRRIVAPAATLAAFAAVLAPWTIRNAVELHALVPISTETGPTLAGTYNVQAMDDRADPGAWRLLRFTEYKRLARRPVGPVTDDAALRDAAVDFVERHPAYPLLVFAENLRRWLDLDGTARAQFEAHTIDLNGDWADAGLPFAWALAALAGLGLVTGAARGTPRVFWLAPAALLLSTLLVNAETPRFRAPFDPFLILLAAAVLARAPAWSPARVRLRASS
jgi:hypothetical protein